MKTRFISFVVFLLTACSEKNPSKNLHDMANMNMDSANKTESAPDEIKLSDRQIQLANIRVDTLLDGMMGDNLVLPATISTDESKDFSISSRVMGRIEKLYFKNIDEYVKKGSKLYDIYSEDLNNAKQELILALEKKNKLGTAIIDFDELIRSAKNKLFLWGMSEIQVNELINTKDISPLTTFYSSSSGYISSFDVKEGDYIMEGGTIVRLVDLSTVWVQAQVYASELSEVNPKSVAFVEIANSSIKEIKGGIEFINPEISQDSRINLIRIAIPNHDNRFKPGMSAYVHLKNPVHKSISVPIDAVLRTEGGATVWVKIGPHSFKNKMVTLGLESGDRIEIQSGLQKGDALVVSGAYLINSEYTFRKGTNPMSGMKM
ncbi:MAG: efflux RND transporter periplasmic adaptor subunit [Chitinophagales bacterium]